MQLKLSLLVTAGLVTLVLATAGSLQSSSNLPDTPLNAITTGDMLLSQGTPSVPPALNPVHPDEPIADTLRDRFSLKNSLERLQQIRSALTSFRQLTANPNKRSSVGNTGWEIQNLGFPNWTGSVEGTLRYQNYQIAKLDFDLATKQFEDKQITQQQLNQKAANYQKALRDLQAFTKTFRVTD